MLQMNLVKLTAQKNIPSLEFSSAKISNYQIKQTIGKGGFAKVKKAIHIQTGQQVAVKIINKSNLDSDSIKRIRNEIEIQRHLFHKNIVRIYQVVEKNQYIYIFMEYCKNGQLFDYINLNGKMSQKQAMRIFNQILDAVRYLHEQKIAHRDIKCQNILIDENYIPKLIDFGLAKKYEASGNKKAMMKKQDELLQTFCGSPSYTSPEIILKTLYNAQLVDVWCLGVTLYVMLAAELPFGSKMDESLKKSIINHKYSIKPYFSTEVEDIFSKIFTSCRRRIDLARLCETKLMLKYPKYETNYINLKRETMIIDQQIISIMEVSFKVDPIEARQSIQKCKFNQNSSLYYLLMKNKSQNGEMSQSDINSPYFKKQRKIRYKSHTIDIKPNPQSQLEQFSPTKSNTLQKTNNIKLKKYSVDLTINTNVSINSPRKLSNDIKLPSLPKLHKQNVKTMALRSNRPKLSIIERNLKRIDEDPESPKRILDSLNKYKNNDYRISIQHQ